HALPRRPLQSSLSRTRYRRASRYRRLVSQARNFTDSGSSSCRRGCAKSSRLSHSMTPSSQFSRSLALVAAGTSLLLALSACSEKAGAGGGGRRGGPGGAAPVIVAQAQHKVVPQTID